MKEMHSNPLQLKSLNHISVICNSLKDSIDFYQNVLGFHPVWRPESLSCEGAWLFGFGVGIHLLRVPSPTSQPKETVINPTDRHISFQCEDTVTVEKKLQEMGIKYVRATVIEGGINVDQLFFHDPDGFMIEICNCDNLPVIPVLEETIRSCCPTSVA